MLAGETLRQMYLRGLERPIGAAAIAFGGGNRGNEDRGSIARFLTRFLEEGERRVEGVDRPKHIDLETGPPALLVIALRERARIGDDDVETAKFLRRVGNPLLQAFAVGDVGDAAGRLHAEPGERRDGLVHLIPVARADGDIDALPRQRFRDGAADAARAAGDDCLLALETEIHDASFLWKISLAATVDRMASRSIRRMAVRKVLGDRRQ